MKKIIGIIGIAAVLASSMFAAEISAKVRLTGSIVSYDAVTYNLSSLGGVQEATVQGSKTSLMTLDTHGAESWNPLMQLSVSTDVAGAGFKFYNGNNDDKSIVTDTAWNIWFKPFDNFKVTMGNYDICLNQEQIDWCNGHTGLGGDGFVFEYAMGDLTLTAFLNTGWGKAWVYAPVDMTTDEVTEANVLLVGKNRISETSVKGAFNSPVGTISASVTYNGTNRVPLEYAIDGKTYKPEVFTDYFKLAAGWNFGNLFGDNISGFVNAWTTVDTVAVTRGWRNYSSIGLNDYAMASVYTGLNKVGAEVYAAMKVDAFNFQVFVPFELNLLPKKDLRNDPYAAPIALYDLFTNYIVLKATYSMSNGVSPYLYVKINPWAGNTVTVKYSSQNIEYEDSYASPSIQVKPGLTGSFGVCGYEIAFDSTITLGNDPRIPTFKFSVPVYLTVNF